ncbi:hypothetical protein ABZ686_20300, partial [Streptomyces sp. NPDC006992]
MEASPRDDSTPADAELSPERELTGPAAMEDREPLPGHELAADADPDEPVAEEPEAEQGPPVEPHELRPQRKLRLWQLAPIVVLGALGSLMFAFPLAPRTRRTPPTARTASPTPRNPTRTRTPTRRRT